MVDVLLTDARGEAGRLVAKSLTEHGVRVSVFDGPSAGNDPVGYIRELKKLARTKEIGMILPVFFPEVLAGHREGFPGINIPIDEASKIHLLDNKISAVGLAERLGIPMPKRYATPAEVTDFPVVFKRPGGQGGDSVYFPATPRALGHLTATSKEYLITEFIEGEDICVDALRWDKFFYATAYRVLEPHGKGISRRRVSVDAPELVAQLRRLLDSVEYRGVCGADFRISADTAQAFFLECNPRFSGGLASAMASGFDIPYLLYRLATGDTTVNAEGLKFIPGVITENV